MKRIVFGLLALAALAAPGTDARDARDARAARADGPIPEDYAYGMKVVVAPGGSVYGLAMPDDVYRGVTRPDVGDVCVFNGFGEVVPFSMERQRSATTPEESAMLPIFPVYGPAGGGADSMSVQVRKDETGALVSVNADVKSGDRTAPGRVVSAYLLDASGLKRHVAKLDFSLGPNATGVVSSIDVEGSSDLNSWYALSSGATVASLDYQGHILERKTVELGGADAKYFRIKPSGQSALPEISAVTATLAAEAVEEQRRWSAAEGRPDTARPGEYTFDLGGHMPVDRIRVRLPQENTLVTTTILSRPDGKSEWVMRRQALLYRMAAGGTELTNPDVTVGPVTDRYWLVRVDKAGGGLGRGMPVVEAGWLPHRLLFVARGGQPFTLAYGSGRLVAARCNAALPEFSGAGAGGKKPEVMPASAGPRETLGGETALRAEVPRDWKQPVLWSVLGLGVLLLGFMAVKLYGQMNKERLG